MSGDGKLIMEITRAGKDDHTPLQMISAERLAHLQKVEAAVVDLLKLFPAEPKSE